MEETPRTRWYTTLALVATLVGGVAATIAVAAPEREDDDYTFFDTLDVHVVNVEVVVTGPGGEPVPGLTSDDFELLEDGRPVEISNFYRVDAAPTALPEPEAVAGAEAPADVEPQPREEPADQQLHLAIFVDGMFLEPINRKRVFDAIREVFADELAAPASLVLATFDGHLEVESLPQFEPGLLRERLATLEKAATRGSLAEMERKAVLRDLQSASRVGFATGSASPENSIQSEAWRTLNSIQIFAEEQYDQARRSTEALKSLVEALAGLPGRKALLYVSGGLARHPGEALFYAWENKYRGMEEHIHVNLRQLSRLLDTTPEIREVARHANANRVTFYTIGAGRGGFLGSVSAEEGALDLTASGSSSGRLWSAELEAIDNSNLGGTLDELAAATGGLSMTNSRNFDKLLTAMNRDFGGYYSLGYTPDRERDGKSHRIKVRVKGHDLKVRHRETYRELTREEVMNGRTRSAVLLGSRDNPLGVVMEFGNAAADEKKNYLVPVMVKVPLGKLVLLPQEEVHVGRIGIFVCARDGKGRTSPVQSIDVPIRIANDKLLTALGQVAGYRVVLEMRGIEHEVAVSVRDELGRVESTVTGTWDPAPTAS